MRFVAALAFTLALLIPSGVLAAPPVKCTSTSQGLTPIMDLGTGTYQGYQGGLYPNGQNTPPPEYLAAGVSAGQAVQPINGKEALLGIGMSNANRFFEAFRGQAQNDTRRNPALTIVNGTKDGADLRAWISPTSSAWSDANQDLSRAGVTPSQVVAVWVLHARSDTSHSGAAFPEGARLVEDNFATLVGLIEEKYPNAAEIHFASLNYMGYGITSFYPYAEPRLGYENEYSLKWLIQDRINGVTSGRTWIGWNASLWADGQTARADTLSWPCTDYADNVHPNATGAAKGGKRILDAYLADVTTPWFRR